MGKARHFKNEQGYDNWVAFGHIHDLMHGNHTEVYIGGKKHKVNHGGFQ